MNISLFFFPLSGTSLLNSTLGFYLTFKNKFYKSITSEIDMIKGQKFTKITEDLCRSYYNVTNRTVRYVSIMISEVWLNGGYDGTRVGVACL